MVKEASFASRLGLLVFVHSDTAEGVGVASLSCCKFTPAQVPGGE